MERITIASAFRLRNKLKAKIASLTDLMERANFSYDKDKTESTDWSDGRTFQEVLTNVSELMTTLRDFNIAIEKANSGNRTNLLRLETVKAEIALYTKIVARCRKTPRERIVYKIIDYGSYKQEFETKDKVLMNIVVDQAASVKRLDELVRSKDSLEETLAGANSSTFVDFDRQRIENLL